MHKRTARGRRGLTCRGREEGKRQSQPYISSKKVVREKKKKGGGGTEKGGR